MKLLDVFLLALSIGKIHGHDLSIAACTALADKLKGKVELRSDYSQDYVTETNHHWSARLKAAKPECVIFASSAQDVSEALIVLKNRPTVQFAIKSGGHDPNPGHNTAPDGVLLTLSKIKGAIYDPASKLAKVKPGGQWSDVVRDLSVHNVTVVGGRLSVVGVGGLISGGGFSFLSPLHGLAADNVVEFETVFPNGTIGRVNQRNNAQLFRAMKGSANNFGVITEFTMRTVALDRVWGGRRLYVPSKGDELAKAFADFSANPPDPRATVIVVTQRIAGVTLPAVFFFYSGETPPPGVFKLFENISSYSDTCATKSFGEVLEENSTGSAFASMIRTSFRTLTFPALPGLAQDITEVWREVNADVGVGVIAGIDLQVFPASIGRASIRNGGNAMGLTADDGERFVVELNYIYPLQRDDAFIFEHGRQMTERMTAAYQRAIVNAGGTPRENRTHQRSTQGKVETYLPLFLNDAQFDQNVFKSFRNYDDLAALQKEVDPERFFHQRSGGFKY